MRLLVVLNFLFLQKMLKMIFKNYEGLFGGDKDSMKIMAEDLIADKKNGQTLYLSFNNAHGLFILDKGLVRYMNDDEIKIEFDKIENITNPNKKLKKENFIMKDDLRDLIHNDEFNYYGYRAKAKEIIEKIGVEKWFKLKGYPTNEESIWKNRYTGNETTLKEEVGNKFIDDKGIEKQGFYLWLNHLPIDIWTDKYLFDCYRKQEDTTEEIKDLEKDIQV